MVGWKFSLRHSGGVSDDDEQTWREFKAAVNMTPAELEKWLDTDDSTSVGQPAADGESVGHHSGRRIVEILRTTKSDLGDDEVAQMRKVLGYIKRHLAQRPDGDIHESRWRYSLMNWGHDPQM